MTDWYAIAHLPQYRILKVRVMWSGHELVVTRMRPRGEIRWAWFEDRKGAEPAEVGLKGEPNCWQPINEAFWGTLKRPPPITTVSERMVSETTRFGAVAEAETADLVKEMEADRETARVQGETVTHAHVKPGASWWNDPNAIKYQPEGEVTAHMAEGRMMRALAWADVGKGLTLFSQTAGDVLASLAEARDSAMSGGDPDPMARFQPLPQDHADFLVSMNWFVRLNPPERRHRKAKQWGLSLHQKVLAWTARPIPLSSGDMAALVGRSDSRMRQVREQAFEMLHRVANGLPARAGWPVVDQMAALKERNRAYRRTA